MRMCIFKSRHQKIAFCVDLTLPYESLTILADCIDAMRQNGIEPKRLQFVAKADDAQPWLFLLEGRSGGKPFLNVLPLRIVGDGSGVTTRLEKTMPV